VLNIAQRTMPYVAPPPPRGTPPDAFLAAVQAERRDRDARRLHREAELRHRLFVEEHVEVEATWGIYQRMIGAYREPDRKHGRALMGKLIESVSHAVPAALTELRRLGRTLTTRAGDVLAYFDRPGTLNVPTEAINGRLEHLRGSALGFRNLTNYIARSLLESGGFRRQLHPRL